MNKKKKKDTLHHKEVKIVDVCVQNLRSVVGEIDHWSDLELKVTAQVVTRQYFSSKWRFFWLSIIKNI